MKRFILILILAFVANAAGLNDGSSWDDAWTNLASVTWTRGDTYYIAGGTYTENVSISVTDTGVWIVLKKANETDNSTNPGWDSTYATTQASIIGSSTSYSFRILSGHFEVDGVTGSGLSGHGIKLQNTYNDGTNQPAPIVSLGAGAGPYHLHHLELAGTGFKTQYAGGDGIYYNNTGTAQSGLHISYCYIHDVDRNGMTLGGLVGTSYTDYGMLFENNVIEDTGGSGNPSFHGQGVQFGYATTDRYTIFRNNIFKDIMGSGMLVYMSGTGNWHTDSRVYNNLFYLTEVTNHTVLSPGVIGNIGGGYCTNILVANNTFYGIASPNLGQARFYSAALENVTLTNNVWENCYFSTTNMATAFGNNAYYNNSGSVPSGTPGQVNGAATTFIDGAGFNFELLATGYAVDAGADLSSVFTTDKDGNTRTAPFDIGAYEGSGLLGWWKFEEGTSTNALDSSGYGNTGHLTNGATWTTGKVGSYAVSLDGSDDYVWLPYHTNWNFGSNWTVAAWVFSKSPDRIVAVGRWTNDLWNGWSLEQITDTRFDAEYQDRTISGETAHRSTGYGLFTTNAWHHVVGLRSNNVVRIFVDTVPGTTSDTITNADAIGNATLNVGSRRSLTADAPWFGYVDDVRVYNRTLSLTEITNLFLLDDEEPEPPAVTQRGRLSGKGTFRGKGRM